MIKGRRRTRGDDGAQAVEFALIIPIVLLIIAGVIQFGFMFNAQVTVTQAAREGARIASLNAISSTCDATCVAAIVKPVVESHAAGLTITDSEITVTACAANSTQTTSAMVRVQYQVNLGAPIVSQTVTVTGKAYMPCGG